MEPQPSNHVWQTPEALAERLGARQHGRGWRTCCPAHGGDNPQAFSISRGTDKQGHPCTLLYCHAYHCSIGAICEALGITLVSLFAVHPEYARRTSSMPRSHDARIERLQFHRTPHSQDDLAQAMLESEIINEAGFLARCPPARETLWRLTREPGRRRALVQALITAGLPVRVTLQALREEWGAP